MILGCPCKMAAHNLRVREQHRELLRGVGFPFCDDHAQAADPTLGQAQHTLNTEFTAAPLQDLTRDGVAASSCDHDLHQNIGNTLSDDEDFWSSTGSGPKHEEYLLYRLASPQCAVVAVHFAVYRARYQVGAPLYPSKTLRFEIGFSKNHMQPVPGEFQVQVTDSIQTFQLPAQSPMGHYLKVIMCGKIQQQFEDRQYFTAVRRVKAIGQCTPPEIMFKAHQLMQSRQLAVSQICIMPASMCPLVLDMAGGNRCTTSEPPQQSLAVTELDQDTNCNQATSQTCKGCMANSRMEAEAEASLVAPSKQIADLNIDCTLQQGPAEGSLGSFIACNGSCGVLSCEPTHQI